MKIHNAAGIIFDMDGVIINSEPVHKKAFESVIREIGWEGKHKLNFNEYIGKSDFELWKDFAQKYKPHQTLEQLIEMKRTRLIELLKNGDLFFPDVVPLIEKLSKRYPLGLASGSEKKVIEAVLALKNMRRFFKAVVSSGDVYKGKPAPDIFILTARLIGVNPSECYVIEDSKPGIKAGLAAGMKVIAITNTYPASELKEANYVVSNYKELEKLLL